MTDKKKFNPIWFLVIGIFFLVVPAAIYIGFLIPQLREEYNVLMASGGVVGGAGLLGTEMIPEKTKYGAIYKTASKSFTLLVVITLVQEFIKELIGLAIVVVVGYIIFLVMKELWRNGKQRKQSAELAESITQGIANTAK